MGFWDTLIFAKGVWERITYFHSQYPIRSRWSSIWIWRKLTSRGMMFACEAPTEMAPSESDAPIHSPTRWIRTSQCTCEHERHVLADWHICPGMSAGLGPFPAPHRNRGEGLRHKMGIGCNLGRNRIYLTYPILLDPARHLSTMIKEIGRSASWWALTEDLSVRCSQCMGNRFIHFTFGEHK